MSMADRDGTASGYQPDDGTSDETGHSTLGPGDLAPDEERLLAALERDARDRGPIPAEAMLPARPVRSGPPDDGLTPQFAAPDFD